MRFPYNEEAINDAVKIVEERASKEDNSGYDKQLLIWVLEGIQNREGDKSVIEYAKSAPFHKAREIISVGYA